MNAQDTTPHISKIHDQRGFEASDLVVMELPGGDLVLKDRTGLTDGRGSTLSDRAMEASWVIGARVMTVRADGSTVSQ